MFLIHDISHKEHLVTDLNFVLGTKNQLSFPRHRILRASHGYRTQSQNKKHKDFVLHAETE